MGFEDIEKDLGLAYHHIQVQLNDGFRQANSEKIQEAYKELDEIKPLLDKYNLKW